ncbi:DUF2279 domain-containing protein [Flavobacterium sp.]|uniref:DUF2279 domain-containing protein n=1 Tax=Flavobacterium sp. TaxID=239 RepID=UPI00352774F7
MKRNYSLYQQALFLLSSLVPQKKILFFAKAIASIRVSWAFIFLLASCFSFSQSKINTFLTPSDTLNKNRKKAVLLTESALLGTTLIGLNQLWYNDFEQTSFHTINDSDEWLQLDKIGHFYSTYHLTRLGAESLAWSGTTQKQQLIYGSTLGFGFLTTIEIFDGFSSEWGFSWTDMIANVSGTGLYVSQELLWNEQRVTTKFSFHTTKYAVQNPDKLGNSFSEQLVKDYNGQTYWLSFNLHSFAKKSKLPKWLNLAIGYGGNGMLFGTNSEALENGFYQNPRRQFYLSLDLDLTKIETKSHFLSTIFSLFSTVKIPAPALQTNDFKGFKAYILYF